MKAEDKSGACSVEAQLKLVYVLQVSHEPEAKRQYVYISAIHSLQAMADLFVAALKTKEETLVAARN